MRPSSRFFFVFLSNTAAAAAVKYLFSTRLVHDLMDFTFKVNYISPVIIEEILCTTRSTQRPEKKPSLIFHFSFSNFPPKKKTKVSGRKNKTKMKHRAPDYTPHLSVCDTVHLAQVVE